MLGDFYYRYKHKDELLLIEQVVSPEPDIMVLGRDEKDQFLLACDGICDVMTMMAPCIVKFMLTILIKLINYNYCYKYCLFKLIINFKDNS